MFDQPFKFLLLFICFSYGFNGFAETFTVTNAADAGTGTLREAIILSNANGFAETDVINFNLPGNRTITLASPLPPIVTSLIIDGFSQPGAALSVNGAKIIVQPTGPFHDAASGDLLNRTDCFFVQNGSSFAIYGMILKNFHSTKPDNRFSTGTGIFVNAAGEHITIGAPGKGNVFYDNGECFEIQGFKNVIIQANLIGIKEDGQTFGTELQLAGGVAPDATFFFGGDDPAEGNVSFGNFDIGGLYDNTQVVVRNNTFGANQNFHREGNAEMLMQSNNFRINIFSQGQSNTSSPPQIIVDHNEFACNLNIAKCNGIALNVNSNTFGTSLDRTKSLSIYSSAISIQQTHGNILIGGSSNALGNVFTNINVSSNETSAHGVIEATASQNVELSHNSFYCNNITSFLYTDKSVAEKPVTVTVSNFNSSSASGITKGNARVELFYADVNCTGCQPRQYLTTVTASTDGHWVYNGVLTPGYGMLASATYNGESSEFSDPKIYLGNVKIRNVTCSNNGSITGVQVVNATNVQWLNETGQVVGNSLDLTAVPVGKYRLRTQQFQCTNYSPEFTILQAPELALSDALIHINDDRCSQQQGSVENITATGGTPPYKFVWTNINGQTIAQTANLENVTKGQYTLTVTDADVCKSISKTYSLGNTDVILTPPIVNNVIACSFPATIMVRNAVAGSEYRLYGNSSYAQYLQQNAKGIFQVSTENLTEYYVTQVINGCESDKVKVNFKVAANPISIENTITPNGDGINDYWKMKGIESFPNVSVEIFDRYGSKVFYSKGYAKAFDGSYEGKMLPVGTYYYIINLGSGCDLLSGSITIVR